MEKYRNIDGSDFFEIACESQGRKLIPNAMFNLVNPLKKKSLFEIYELGDFYYGLIR